VVGLLDVAGISAVDVVLSVAYHPADVRFPAVVGFPTVVGLPTVVEVPAVVEAPAVA